MPKDYAAQANARTPELIAYVSAATTLAVNQTTVEATANTASGDYTVTLPPVALSRGQVYTIRASIANSKTVTVAASGEALNGSATWKLDADGDELVLYSDGRAWHVLQANGPAIFQTVATSQITTAAAVTFTAAQMLGGYIPRDPAGGARADKVDTAANIVAAMPNVKVNDSFEFIVQNDADAAETITLTTNTGCTMSGTMTIAQNNSKRFRAVVTNVGTPAVTIYALGTYVT